MMEITEKMLPVSTDGAEYWADMAHERESTVRARENLARVWAQSDYDWRFSDIKKLLSDS